MQSFLTFFLLFSAASNSAWAKRYKDGVLSSKAVDEC